MNRERKGMSRYNLALHLGSHSFWTASLPSSRSPNWRDLHRGVTGTPLWPNQRLWPAKQSHILDWENPFATITETAGRLCPCWSTGSVIEITSLLPSHATPHLDILSIDSGWPNTSNFWRDKGYTWVTIQIDILYFRNAQPAKWKICWVVALRLTD